MFFFASNNSNIEGNFPIFKQGEHTYAWIEQKREIGIMPRIFTPKVITANALIEGDVVYLTTNDLWTRHHCEAELIEDEAHAQIRLLDAERRSDEVVGPYLADAEHTPDGPIPVHFREALRTTGPSNYRHGKQVELV